MTVKPITLTKYLATLLLPPPEYAPRRLLVSFSGSGSEMIGALLAGWEHITGIEIEPDYCDIARARLDFFSEWMHKSGHVEPKEIIKAAQRNGQIRKRQMELL